MKQAPLFTGVFYNLKHPLSQFVIAGISKKYISLNSCLPERWDYLCLSGGGSIIGSKAGAAVSAKSANDSRCIYFADAGISNVADVKVAVLVKMEVSGKVKRSRKGRPLSPAKPETWAVPATVPNMPGAYGADAVVMCFSKINRTTAVNGYSARSVNGRAVSGLLHRGLVPTVPVPATVVMIIYCLSYGYNGNRCQRNINYPKRQKPFAV